MSQNTEIEELEAVIATQDLLDLHWGKQSPTRYNHWHQHARGESAGKAKRPKSSSSVILVVRQTRRNKSVLLFQRYLISCKVMVFLSICFLLCYYSVRLYFLLKHDKTVSVEYSCFLTLLLKLLFTRFSYKYSQRICAFISKFYLVISILYFKYRK